MSTRSAKLEVFGGGKLRTTRSDLPYEARRKSADVLNGVLAEMIDVSLAARHVHWNARGPSFLNVHELCGRVQRELDEHIDEIGERVSALGAIARGTLQSAAGETALDAFPRDTTSDAELLDALAIRLAQLGSATRHAAEVCTPLPDIVSVHYLTEAAAAVDKLLWLVEAHLARAH